MYVCAPVVCLVPQRSEEGIGSLDQMVVNHHVGAGDRLNPGPLQEQQVLLTTEPTL